MDSSTDKALDYGDEAVERPAARVITAAARAVDLQAPNGAVVERLLNPSRKTDDPPKVEEFCATPGELSLTVPLPGRPEYRSVLGTFAERRINVDYCERVGCQPFLQPNSEGTDYFDNTGGSTVLIAFLKDKNDHLTEKDIESLAKSSFIKHALKRPDIIKHTDTHQNYYEVKPDSPSGRYEGRQKIGRLETLFLDYNLPYTPGAAYTPTAKMPLATVTVEKIAIEVFMRVRRPESALVLYRFCMRGELAEASRRLGKRVRRLALFGLLLGALIPIDDPIELPERGRDDDRDLMPEPMPMPIPASVDDETFVVPVPFEGQLDRGFTFHYVRGLSRSGEPGVVYPIVISYRSRGELHHTVIDFRLKNVERGVSRLVSENRTALNIAPDGHEPLVIRVRTHLTVTWHN